MRILSLAMAVVCCAGLACNAGSAHSFSMKLRNISLDSQDISLDQGGENENSDEIENSGDLAAVQDEQLHQYSQENQDEESDDLNDHSESLAHPEGDGYEVPASLSDDDDFAGVEHKEPVGGLHPSKIIGMANPASVNCGRLGGQSITETLPGGGASGVCRFKNGYECVEWAMFRKECPEGGVNVSEYKTPASRYCAILGGEFMDAEPSADTSRSVDSARLETPSSRLEVPSKHSNVPVVPEPAATSKEVALARPLLQRIEKNSSSKEKGGCRLPNGHICKAQDVWEGLCR